MGEPITSLRLRLSGLSLQIAMNCNRKSRSYLNSISSACMKYDMILLEFPLGSTLIKIRSRTLNILRVNDFVKRVQSSRGR